MSRHLWRCRNPRCPVPHGAVLGRLTTVGALIVAAEVRDLWCYFDSQHALLTCPGCGQRRHYRGPAVMLRHSQAPKASEVDLSDRSPERAEVV